MRTFDVVIVGAGLAGLSCAETLAQNGISVLLVDRKPDLTKAIHTTGIFVRRTLEDFTFSPDLLGPPIRHVAIHSPRGRTQWLESSLPEFRVGRMAQIYETLLDRCVAAGTTWMPDAHFVGIETGSIPARVALESPRSREWARGRFVVGADGASSRVAVALGLDSNTSFVIGVEEIIAGCSNGKPPALHCFLDPKLAPGYIGWVADDGETIHLGVGGVPGRFSPVESLNRLRELVADQFGLPEGRVIERRGGKIPVGSLLRRISSSHGLLVGDAAGAVSPLTAGGLDGAIRLSRFAAELLTLAITRDDPSLLDLYDSSSLRSRFLSRRWMRQMLAAVESPRLVELGCTLLRLPILRSIPHKLFFGRGSFPDPDRTRLIATLRLTETTRA